MTDNPDKKPAGNETQTRVRPISIRKVLGAFMLVVLAIVIVNSVISANQNFSNRFKEGFYFEKYSNAKQARAALLKLHPIGSDKAAFHRTLVNAGAYDIQGINRVTYRYIENKGSIFDELWVASIEVDAAVIKNISVRNSGMAK